MMDHWKIEWNSDGWLVELSRRGGSISIFWIAPGASGHPEFDERECRVFRGGSWTLIWPWKGVPTDPAEVIATVRRLADEYLGPAQ